MPVALFPTLRHSFKNIDYWMVLEETGLNIVIPASLYRS